VYLTWIHSAEKVQCSQADIRQLDIQRYLEAHACRIIWFWITVNSSSCWSQLYIALMGISFIPNLCRRQDRVGQAQLQRISRE
jgi:hypothetical protein